jgi:hypothetical protein
MVIYHHEHIEGLGGEGEAAGDSPHAPQLFDCDQVTGGNENCAGGTSHGSARSGRLAGGDDGEVDFSLGDFVDVVRPGVERDVEHDLDHLCIVIAG